MSKLMLSCKRATELLDRKAHVELKPVEKFQLFLHTKVCDACRLYEKQGHILDSILKKQVQRQDESNHAHKSLSPEAKSQIIKKLENR